MKRKNNPYTEKEIKFIQDNWQDMTDPELAENLGTGRTSDSIRTWRYRNDCVRLCDWNEMELAYLEEQYPNTNTRHLAEKMGRSVYSVYGKANTLGLQKSEEFKNSPESGRIMPGECHPGSVKSQFKKGHTPHNKGKKGVFHPGCEKTWFKKGHTPHNTKYNGAVSLRKDKNGRHYVWVRVAKNDWVMLQHINWEKENGPIPDGYMLVSKDGDTLNTDPSNWEPITRADHARRNRDWRKAMATMREKGNHPSVNLTDKYIAGILGARDAKLKEYLLNERPDIIKAARAHYKLNRKIRNYEHADNQ